MIRLSTSTAPTATTPTIKSSTTRMPTATSPSSISKQNARTSNLVPQPLYYNHYISSSYSYILPLSLSLGAIFMDVGDHVSPQFSAPCFLQQLAPLAAARLSVCSSPSSLTSTAPVFFPYLLTTVTWKLPSKRQSFQTVFPDNMPKKLFDRSPISWSIFLYLLHLCLPPRCVSCLSRQFVSEHNSQLSKHPFMSDVIDHALP